MPVTTPRSRILATTLLAASLLAASGTASAGWLDRLKGMLGGDETAETAAEGASLSTDQISRGLKEALRVGTENVVAQLGTEGGFNRDPEVHIPLPPELRQVKNVLSRIGMEGTLEELETELNRAAEVATPKAKTLFFDAISQMTLDDVRRIYEGPDDAATRYFRGKMAEPLAAQMRPVVDESLADVGAARTWSSVVSRYNELPMVPPLEADLTSHVVDRGIDGIFFYLAQEERAIREDPLARSTELLKTVFGER